MAGLCFRQLDDRLAARPALRPDQEFEIILSEPGAVETREPRRPPHRDCAAVDKWAKMAPCAS